jgi:hypothetical protein
MSRAFEPPNLIGERRMRDTGDAVHRVADPTFLRFDIGIGRRER